jgi:cold shock protein
MHFGTIRNWDPSKGFGFITSDQDEDFFVHSSDLDITLDPTFIREGLKVKFEIQSNFKGDRATRVRKA